MELESQLEMMASLIESLFLTSFSEKEEETIPVIISPHQTILASLGKAHKDRVTHGGACSPKAQGPRPLCPLTAPAPWVCSVPGWDPGTP